MSDLYLILSSRLEAVKEWIHVGEETMLGAREALGLSRESVARQLHIASKTYERHEKDGRIPRYRVGDYARVLGLNITEPERESVSLPGEPESFQDVVREMRATQDQILDELAALRKERAPDSPARSRRAGGRSA
jgi:DNA-binding XRE family transcriptional regulator